MSKETQIEEMANYIDKSHWRIEQDFTGCHINSVEIAEYLYNAGYRKQERISVDERLPEDFGVFLCYGYLNSNGMSCTSLVQFCGKWIPFDDEDFTVTHWMPLPQPPKMRKEGEGK